jgi:hypothetical protein
MKMVLLASVFPSLPDFASFAIFALSRTFALSQFPSDPLRTQPGRETLRFTELEGERGHRGRQTDPFTLGSGQEEPWTLCRY